MDAATSTKPGSESFTVNLPFGEGNHVITNLLPADMVGNPANGRDSTLEVDVTWTQVGPANGGYTGGYKGLTAAAQIDFTIRWVPPVKRLNPPDPPADLTDPALAFPVPGGAGGDEVLATNFAFDVPGVPGAPVGSPVLGLAYDNVNGQVLVLVDGTTQDILLELDATFGFLNDFTPLSLNGAPVDDAQDVAFIGNNDATDGDAWVMAATPNTSSVIFDPFADPLATDTPFTLPVPGFPGEFPGGLAGVNDIGFPGELITAELQTNPVLGITIHRINVLTESESNPPFGVPAGATGGGFNDIVSDTGSTRYQIIGSFGNALAAFDPFGPFVFGTKSTTLTDIVGLAMQTNGDTLYLADAPASASKIYTADLAAGGGGGGPKFPKAIASEGADSPHYLLLDQDPDQIMEVNADGVQQGAPFTVAGYLHLESLTFLDGFLYTVEGGNTPPRTLYKIDPATEAVAAGYPKPLPNFINDIGGLTTDGTDLIAVERFNDVLHFIDPASAAVLNSIPLFTAGGFGPGSPFLPFGLEGMAYVTTGGGDPFLLGVRFPTFFEIDPNDGEVSQVFDVAFPPPFHMTGITQSGDLVLMADSGTQAVYSAGVPGAPPPEDTVAGDYVATFSMTLNPAQPPPPQTKPFAIERVDTLVVTITQPLDGDAFITSPITLEGTVTDPTVKTVSLGVDLPSTDLFVTGGETAEERERILNTAADPSLGGVSGLWHFTNDFADAGNPRAIGDWSLAYTRDPINDGPAYDFNTGTPNTGGATGEPFEVGANTKFCSSHWYDTEGGIDFDRMLIKLKTYPDIANTTAADQTGNPTLLQIVSFPPPFIGAFPESGTKIDVPGFPQKFVFIEPFEIDNTGAPIFTEVCVKLDNFIGQTVKVQVSFDSGDDIGNNGEGWFVDEIQCRGRRRRCPPDPKRGKRGLQRPVRPGNRLQRHQGEGHSERVLTRAH